MIKLPFKRAGFSLVEITVVLFILGLILAGTITPLSLSIDQAQRNDAEKRIDSVETAILGFTLTNQRLPCPDCPTGTGVAACTGNENDGIEDISAGQCILGTTNAIAGNIPWVSLGINGRDSWGRVIQYAVDAEYADTTADTTNKLAGCTNPVTTNSFSLCSQAVITINDAGATCVGTPNAVAQSIPYIVFSHGQEESDATSTLCNELENVNGNNNFVSRDYTEDNTLYFDDLIFWGSPFILNSQMVKAELLP